MIDLIFIFGNVGVLLTISFLIWTRQNESLKKIFWPFLILKVLAGSGVGLVYSFFYDTGDTFQYFEDGKTLAAFAADDPLQFLQFLWNEEGAAILEKLRYSDARALFFVKLVSVLNLLTHNNYWIASTYCSLVSFLGSLSLIRAIRRFLPQFTTAACIALQLFPSIVFWTSGLIKESLASAALFYLVALFIQGWFGVPIEMRKSIVGVLALWILWSLKYYYAAVLIPVVFTCFAYKHLFVHVFKPVSIAGQTILWFGIFFFPLVLISFAHPNFYYETFLQTIVSNNAAYDQFSQPEDVISYYHLSATFGSLVLNSPLALFSGLFRPMFYEAGNILQLLSAIENLLLLGLCLLNIRYIGRSFGGEYHILSLALMVYVSLLCVFLALSTPNFGTLSRYRTGYLPFFIMFLLSHEKTRMWLQRFNSNLDR